MAAEDVSTINPMSSRLVNAMAGCPCKYVRNNDFLRLDARSSVASVVLQFTGLLLTTWGDYVPLQFELRPTSDRASTTAIFKLTEGFLYHLQCRVSSGTVRRGQCFVKVGLQQGDNDLAMLHTTILSDYVDLGYEVAYPGSPIRSSLEGPGIMRVFSGTNPAAGADWTETVPTNAFWEVKSIMATVAVANSGAAREVNLNVTDGTTEFHEQAVTAAATINASTTYLWAQDVNEQSAFQNLHSSIPIPAFRLPQGSVISSTTGAIVAGDDWTAPIIYLEEWIEE